ncbi:septum site-determining protein MinD [Bacillus taeanensis]|uniref:Septum site-determining protein MinD n=1 Tax=Bacillus taeanensis TaxID=273032 RepID=A0A366XXE0_9BACI|nr:septum site-determining protein MinD [Bacillus taeanensis]RBW70802.1 septum site-determining protein MinD [Bacillus taeanensis]
MGKVIVVTSGKGGVGKTSFTANFGAGLALEGKKVCLIDADIGLRNLDIPLGLSNRIVFDIYDVMDSKCSIDNAIITSKDLSNLSFIPGSKDRTMDELNMKRFQTIVSELKKIVDYVIIDSPAGIESGFEFAVSSADEALIVTTLDQTAVRDADRVIGIIEERFNIPLKFVVNAVPIKKNKVLGSIDVIKETLQIECLGSIYWNEVFINQKSMVVIDPKIKSGLEYRQLTRDYLGERSSQLNSSDHFYKDEKHFLNFLMKLWKRKGKEKNLSQKDICSSNS